jgi:hypothetical protein
MYNLLFNSAQFFPLKRHGFDEDSPADNVVTPAFIIFLEIVLIYFAIVRMKKAKERYLLDPFALNPPSKCQNILVIVFSLLIILLCLVDFCFNFTKNLYAVYIGGSLNFFPILFAVMDEYKNNKNTDNKDEKPPND